ncbi:hypothetical protein GCM10027423_44680 [Spirosoma arcticum]
MSVEAYAHLTLPESTALLDRLPLSQYDLIVLQLGPDLIQRTVFQKKPVRSAGVRVLPILNQPIQASSRAALPQLMKRVGRIGKTLLDVAASVVPGFGCPAALAQLLTLLRPYRHTVLLMTPFPCRTVPEQWARARSRSVLLATGMSQAFSVFDTEAVVQPRDEYFLTGDNEHLNAVSHELIGRALFDFYQSAPTIVTVHTTNRK